MNAANNTSKKMGVLQDRVAAPYDFSISEIIKEAWARVTGMKASVWGAIGYIYLVSLAFVIVGFFINLIFPHSFAQVLLAILYLTLAIIAIPLRVGFYYLGVRRSVDLPVRAKSIFSMLSYTAKFVGLVFLQFLFIFLIALFSIIPAVIFHQETASAGVLLMMAILQFIVSLAIFYVILSFMFSYFLVAEKKLGIYAAFKVSFFAFSQHWFKIIVTFIAMMIIIIISAIPLGIGLIWTIPMGVNLFGILYRTAFGVEEVRK